jgi:hypothetical protein
VRAKLFLATRTYGCDCGLEIDRHVDAVRNLAAYGRRQRVSLANTCALGTSQSLTCPGVGLGNLLLLESAVIALKFCDGIQTRANRAHCMLKYRAPLS